MMARPTRYYVEYEDADLAAAHMARHGGEVTDPAECWTIRDFTTFDAADQFARANAFTAFVYERVDIRDDTPAGFPVRGWWWDWDVVRLAEYP